MKKLNLRLIRLIKNSYGQVIAVITVIAIGLLVYTAMKMAALNLQSTLNEYYDLTNFGDIYVQVVKIPSNAVEDLKNKYACGGTAKDGYVFLQGDHRDTIKETLISLGFPEESIELH